MAKEDNINEESASVFRRTTRFYFATVGLSVFIVASLFLLSPLFSIDQGISLRTDSEVELETTEFISKISQEEEGQITTSCSHKDDHGWLIGCGIVHSSVALPPGAPADRRDRFPSFTQRLKMHTGYWYLPPCNVSGDAVFYRYFEDERNQARLGIHKGPMSAVFEASVDLDEVIWFDLTSKFGTDEYIDSTAQFLLPWWQELNAEEAKDPPLIMLFGDYRDVPIRFEPGGAFPVIGKVRRVLSPPELSQITDGKCAQSTMDAHSDRAVIHFVEVERHLGTVFKIDELDVVPWEEKISQAIFRSATSGFIFSKKHEGEEFLQQILATTGDGSTDLGGDHAFALELVRKLRFQFCWHYRSSDHFNTGMVPMNSKEEAVLRRMGVLRESMNLSDMLKYKAIVVIEGNDVATSLNWVLYSHSVPLMAKPTVVSFAMEEFLEPWVHYVPLNANMTDAEEKMQWVLDHDEEARIIAERGRLFIHDFMFHPDAEDENRRLEKEILRRVRAHFQPVP